PVDERRSRTEAGKVADGVGIDLQSRWSPPSSHDPDRQRPHFRPETVPERHHRPIRAQLLHLPVRHGWSVPPWPPPPFLFLLWHHGRPAGATDRSLLFRTISHHLFHHPCPDARDLFLHRRLNLRQGGMGMRRPPAHHRAPYLGHQLLVHRLPSRSCDL